LDFNEWMHGKKSQKNENKSQKPAKNAVKTWQK
jgi:hypothetical protein